MFASTTRATTQRIATRNFSASVKRLSGHPAEGVYTNIPFKVKNRKIPLAIPFYGTFGFFFAFPFIASYIHLVKAGSFEE